MVFAITGNYTWLRSVFQVICLYPLILSIFFSYVVLYQLRVSMIIRQCRIDLGYVQVVYFLNYFACLIAEFVPANDTPHGYTGTCDIRSTTKHIR